ncbi:MAG: hypothetical protein H0X24_21000 [Ktedonobacterales bacterium]|nr:hypothetical protein [Ktedonobacterales bacterium]
MIDRIIQALESITMVFDTLSIPYYIGGSVSAYQYGYQRATNDIDIIADIQEAQAYPLAMQLGNDYYADAEMIRDAIRRRSSCNFIHLSTGLKVDIFLLKDTPYTYEQMRRRHMVSFDATHQFPVSRSKIPSSPSSTGTILAAKSQIGNGKTSMN